MRKIGFGGGLRKIGFSSIVDPDAAIKALFDGGKQGAFYDPSDLPTMFKDSTGTQPVTADGDPVGLRLDKSQGLVHGSELVTNGNFNNNINGWEVDQPTRTTATWTKGRVLVSPIPDSAASNQSLKQNVALKAGTTYKLSIEHEGTKTFRVNLGGAYVVFDIKGAGKQVYTGYVTLSSAASTMYIEMASAGTWLPADMYLDNISVKELKGNHATQSVSAARPTYKKDTTKSWLYHDKVDDNMFVTLPAMAATVVTATDDGVTINYPVSIPSGAYTLTNNATLGRDYGRLIIDKELSAAEQAQVTAYFNAKRGV